MSRYFASPGPEPTMTVDCFHPLSEKTPFRFVLFVVLTLHFEHENFSIREPDEKVRTEHAHNASVNVRYLESQMIVFHPCGDVRVSVQLECFARFPSRIENA
jgi:hypothetical protein